MHCPKIFSNFDSANKIPTIQIDCTTDNNVYDPTDGQGQWFQHRWGRRNYPNLSLGFEHAYIHCADSDQVQLNCTYGDPLCWPQLSEFLQVCHKPLIIHTTANVCDFSLVRQLLHPRIEVVITLDGIEEQCGRVFLGADWQTILANLQLLRDRCSVKFQTYEHNCYQIPRLLELAQKYKFAVNFETPAKNDRFGTAVIDQDCNWLYDVIPVDVGELSVESVEQVASMFPQPETGLKKHTWSYNSLKTFMPRLAHRSILENPLVGRVNYMPDREQEFLAAYQHVDGKYITPDNQTFWNGKTYSAYMLMLADDWKFSNSYLQQNADNRPVQELAFFARKFLEDYV